MAMNRRTARILGAAAAGTAALVTLRELKKVRHRKEEERQAAIDAALVRNRDYGSRRACLIGGGLASMAAAAYLIRDCNFPGSHITIYEGTHILGGGNDGAGTPEKGYVCRGGHMLNEKTYENFWELFDTIPSLKKTGRSVAEEIQEFAHSHSGRTHGRLADREGTFLNVKSMGFDQGDRMALFRLLLTDEKKLDSLTIEDWFKETPHIFETSFWYMWQTAFAFKKGSSLSEFRRRVKRMLLEFGRIDTREGMIGLPLNPYDSLIRPLEVYLRSRGVEFIEDCQVTDMEFASGSGITVKTLYLKRRLQDEDESRESFAFEKAELKQGDFCIMTTGCMTDSFSLGDMDTPAPAPSKKSMSSELWSRIACVKPGMGAPEPFFACPEKNSWMSFTVTARGDALLKAVEEFSGNAPGSGALMTFKDSGWLISSTVAAQPYFAGQPEDVTVFWGYGLYPEAEGDYVKKPMKDCTGREILKEYLSHLHVNEKRMEELMDTVINVIPCRMPYADAALAPRKYTDRPKVIPAGSGNFAMIGQFVEIPEDTAFTEEYSVRAARMAVYSLMDVRRKVIPVTPYWKHPRVLLKTVLKAFR